LNPPRLKISNFISYSEINHSILKKQESMDRFQVPIYRENTDVSLVYSPY
jgi:hypothetical protein